MLLAFIRERNTSQSVIDVFNSLSESLGADPFKELFPVILTDSGSEFSNPKVFEIFEDDYPYAIIDQILTKNPYGQEIEKAFNSETRPLVIKPFQRKKGSKKKSRKK